MKIRKLWYFAVIVCVVCSEPLLHRGSRHIKRSMLDADPCLDVNSVDPSTVNFSKQFSSLQRPWIRDDEFQPKMFTGPGIAYQWAWMKALLVKGLRKSIEDVLQFMNRRKCLFIPVGSVVRGIVLRSQPVWLSGEVSCDISKLYTDCVKTFGASACSLYPMESSGWGEYRLEIGDSSVNSTTDQIRAEPVTIYGWRSIIGNETKKWPFSVDMMAIYDDGVGSTYLVDVTGNGYRDACDKKLVAAVGEKKWDEWSDNQMMKVMGFYDLRANGFSVSNSNFQTYVNEKISKTSKEDAQTFYCEHILKGVVNLGDGTTTICYTMYPERESSRKISTMREIMIREMGKSWNETVGLAGDQMEAVFRTTKQFFEVRSRLKHRVHSEDGQPSSSEEIEPKKIVNGKPMISDMAEIHKRPIVTMSEEPVRLPAEFPSMPNAKPDSNMEFVEPTLAEVGRQRDPVAYEVSREESDKKVVKVDIRERPIPDKEEGFILDDSLAEDDVLPPASTDSDISEILESGGESNEPLKDYESMDFNSNSRVFDLSTIMFIVIVGIVVF